MKKIILLVLLGVVLFSWDINAQNRSTEVGKLEFEIGGGILFSGINDGVAGERGFHGMGEFRYNILPFLDAGLQFAYSRFDRNYIHEFRYTEIQNNIISAFCDYNWRAADDMNFFVGLGIGYAAISNNIWYTNAAGTNRLQDISSVSVNPRFGFELFNQVRFTFEYKITKREFSYWGASLGYVFGGRNK